MVAPQYSAIASILMPSGSRMPSSSRIFSGALYEDISLLFLENLEFAEHSERPQMLETALDIRVGEVPKFPILERDKQTLEFGLLGHDALKEPSATFGSPRQDVLATANRLHTFSMRLLCFTEAPLCVVFRPLLQHIPHPGGSRPGVFTHLTRLGEEILIRRLGYGLREGIHNGKELSLVVSRRLRHHPLPGPQSAA